MDTDSRKTNTNPFHYLDISLIGPRRLGVSEMPKAQKQNDAIYMQMSAVVAEKWELPKCIVVWQGGFLNTPLKAEMYMSALDTVKPMASIFYEKNTHKKKT